MLGAGNAFSVSTALVITLAATAAGGADTVSITADTAGDLDPRLSKVSRSLQQGLVIEGQKAEVWDVEERMKKFSVPAVSVAVIDNGQLAAAGAWGVVVAGDDEPVTTDTIFQAGSVSKPVAALLALSLIQDETLLLDQPINEVLRSWKVPDNEFTRVQAVTLRHVLSHQAGFTRFAYILPRSETKVPGMAELLRGGIHDWPAISVEFVPGSKYEYSNAGYCVLQLMLEDSTQLSLHEFASRRIFGPLDMGSSRFDEPLSPSLLATAASGHLRKREDGASDHVPVPVDGKAEIAPGATGGLWSTPSDLARVAVEVMAAWRGESDTLIDRELAHLFMTPQADHQGLGIHVAGEGKSLRAMHAGQMTGFITHLVFYPDSGKGAVVMSSSDGGRWLNREFLAAIASEFGWPDFPVRRTLATMKPDELQELVGVYAFDNSPRIKLTVTLEDGVAIGQVNKYPKFELTPTTERDLFVLPRQSLEIVFKRTDDGTIRQVVMRQAGDSGGSYTRVAAP